MTNFTTIQAEAYGRVNLIGEHTDYNGGFVLPTCIPQKTQVFLRKSDGPRVRLSSEQFDTTANYMLGSETPTGDWSDYVKGVTKVLRMAGFGFSGFQGRIQSQVPVGSGLSSSAALDVSLLKGLRQLFGLKIDDLEIARLAQRVENDFVGARVGIMDPLVCALGKLDEALFLDARNLSFRRIPLPTDIMEILVIDTGVSHSNVEGGYNQRRAECESACALLGIWQLRDLAPSELARLNELPEILSKRARHVVLENARVLAAVDALESKDLVRLGTLLWESHCSLRDDYEVSRREIDVMVEIAMQHDPIFGARLTGGGFGGAIVALARVGHAARIGKKIKHKYFCATGLNATVLVPAAG